MQSPNAKSVRGFTLIELSIAVIIIGLLIAAILIGITMKRGAGAQALIADEARYVEAARQFKEKYAYLPGDFPNATSYWSAASGCPDPGAGTPQTAVCNGNGNGMIEGDGTGAAAWTTANVEAWQAWEQLAVAGLIEGSFSGSPGSGSGCKAVPGGNLPATRLPGGAMQWMLFNASGSMTASFLGPLYYKHYLLAGGATSGGCDAMDPLLTAAEAYSLDAKIDDGMPGMGTILSVTNTYNSQCTTGNAAASSKYVTNLTTSSPACVLLFQVDF